MTARVHVPIPVVLCKLPRPGEVKTRLTGPGGVAPTVAAEIAWALLACTVERLAVWGGRVALAVTPDAAAPLVAARLGSDPAVGTIGQGGGDLGARLARIWARTTGGPVAFFGADAPDVPGSALEDLAAALTSHEACLGPTPDGGYWALAARRPIPELVARIDWGTERVYDQTLQRARRIGVRLFELPTWPDIDRPADLVSLRRRLEPDPGEPALRRLAARLEALCGPLPDAQAT